MLVRPALFTFYLSNVYLRIITQQVGLLHDIYRASCMSMICDGNNVDGNHVEA